MGQGPSRSGSDTHAHLNERLRALGGWLDGFDAVEVEIFDPDSPEFRDSCDAWWESLGVRLLRADSAGLGSLAPAALPSGAFSGTSSGPKGSAEESEGRRVEIRLAYSHGAFGSGSHPSTISAARGLDLLRKKGAMAGCHMLDVGTGTGILAILGALFGAERVSAMDIEPHAVESAGRNAEASGVSDRIELHCGSLERLNLAPPDVIVANLTPSVMIQLFESMARLLREGGFMVLAGFEASSETASWISEQAERSAMHIEALFETQGWAGVVLQKGRQA